MFKWVKKEVKRMQNNNDAKIYPKGRKIKILKRLFPYIAQKPLMLLSAVLMAVVGNLLMLFSPKFNGIILDTISLSMTSSDFQKIYYYVSLIVITTAISALMSYFLNITMAKIAQNVIYTLRDQAFKKLSNLPVGYFDTHRTGDIISRFSYDVETVGETLCQDVVYIATALIGIIGSFIMMLTISPVMICVFIITIPLSLYIASRMSRVVKPLYRKRSAKLGQLNGYMEEFISGVKTIKAYNCEETVYNKFDEKNVEAVEAHYKADYMSSTVGPAINFVNNLSMAVIGVFGAFFYLLGLTSIGSLSSFILYSRKFSGPLNEIANILSELQSAISAAERIFFLIDEEEEIKDKPTAEKIKDPQGEIEFSHVRFSYDKEKEVIHDLSFKAPKGSLIAIAGPTGAGKTTIINLLMRFYEVDEGKITLDGKDIRDLALESLRKSFAMVLQDTWLFKGTVFENIAYGKEGATLEEVKKACRDANIASFIERLPDGYNTVISEDGGNLSQGQKQLLTIARAMLLDANMLILDEATSNVDTLTEVKIQEAMRKLMENKTCFVIAHRLSTIRNADTILVVRNGEITEQGSHSELLAKKGFYAALYESRFE